jgi:hypothetical protein
MDDAYIESLIEQYTVVFMAAAKNAHEAEQMAIALVDDAWKEVIERGLDKLPPNYGDVLLNEEAVNSKLKSNLDRRRAEGVTDDDIRWWWNLSPIERVLIEKDDERNRVSAYITLRTKGYDKAAAAKKVFRIHPKFGEPTDESSADRPLPIELKRRILDYLDKCQRNYAALTKLTEELGSLNAVLRLEISRGNM